jgi:formamidase
VKELSRKLGVAGLQLKKDYINEANNFSNFKRVATIQKRSYPWIDLIFTGELFLQPYGSEGYKSTASPIPNDTTDKLSELAKDLECWIVPGSFMEEDGSKIYNTSLAFNPDGDIVAKYRKIYPWKPHEDIDWGDEFVTFDIPGIGRIGMVICYDLWFPEVIRTLTWMGADLILQPSLTCTSDRPAELILPQAHAIMFQCYFLNINVICPQGGGESIFVDPEGRILQQAGTAEKVLTEVIDFDKVRWVRQHGFNALNPIWKSFRDYPIGGKFPPYEKNSKGEIFKNLGSLTMQKDIRKWNDE